MAKYRLVFRAQILLNFLLIIIHDNFVSTYTPYTEGVNRHLTLASGIDRVAAGTVGTSEDPHSYWNRNINTGQGGEAANESSGMNYLHRSRFPSSYKPPFFITEMEVLPNQGIGIPGTNVEVSLSNEFYHPPHRA